MHLDNVVQLHEDHKVFVSERIIKEVKRDSSINTTSAQTRFILKRVFTEEALLACSVFGRPSACKGRDAVTCKPALDEFVLARAEKNWKSAVRATVAAALANVICEGRDQQQLENSAQ
ncbi:hypothetical protein ONE63_008205 [Megalurothrips usitatus]|uniref:BEN domain-containing protein n=1 Tax=Megalurothrips usitatus TaxID=439358 RepID=A0AAV7XKE4_9NEOP|nr:hypothetical protein ONE63_008205 [Megalurothrips usitatus]